MGIISPTIKTSVHESASGLLGPTPSSSTWTCKKGLLTFGTKWLMMLGSAHNLFGKVLPYPSASARIAWLRRGQC